jgi:glycine/D-amino acid oxidase-like deaminating enzyme
VKGYTAKRLPQHTGPAAWNDILGTQPTAMPLSDDTIADFVVIGGGFAGLSAARRLTQLQPGTRIAVLEAGRLAEGAAGRNSGFMIDLPHDLASDDYAGQGADADRLMIGLNRHAIEFARAAVEDYGIDPNYFDPAGKVNGSASVSGDAHNASYATHLSSLDESSEVLDAQAMYELTGSRHYRSGLFTPGTVMIQPAGYIRSMGEGLQRTAEFYENSPVVKFSKVGPDWCVHTAKASVTTPRIILANNGHLESFGFAKGRLMQLFLYASMTPEMTTADIATLGGQPRWGITPSDPMGTTMRRIDTGQGGNRIITRTCATLHPDMTASKADVVRAANVQQEKFDSRFPQLAGMKMEYRWAGHLCLSLNGVSVMREVDDGVFSACVQNGLGIARGTMTGIGAAELACSETSEITRYFTSEEQPKRLPPQPFAKIGANAYLRWKEWRAGNE